MEWMCVGSGNGVNGCRMGVWWGMYNDVIEKMIGVCVFGYEWVSML